MRYERLGNLIVITKGKKVTSVGGLSPAFKHRYIQAEDLRSNENPKYTDQSDLVEVTPADIIIAWEGSHAGTAGYNLSGVIANTLAQLKIKNPDEIVPAYLAWFLQSQLNHLTRNSAGTTIRSIERTSLENLGVPIPPIETQRQVISVLEKAQGIVDKRKKNLQLLDQLLQDTFLDLFGDPGNNSKNWKKEKLDNYIELLTVGPKSWSQYAVNKPGSIYLTIQNIGYNEMLLENFNYVQAPKTEEAARVKVQPGDIVMSIAGEFGKSGVIPELPYPAYINQQLCIIRLTGNLNPHFLSALLATKSWIFQLNTLSKGMARTGLNPDDIKRHQIIVPPDELQKKYETFRADITIIKSGFKKSLQGSETLLKSLLQNAFIKEGLELHTGIDQWIAEGLPLQKDITLDIKPIKFKDKEVVTEADAAYKEDVKRKYEFIRRQLSYHEKDPVAQSLLNRVDNFLASMPSANTAKEIDDLLNQHHLPGTEGIGELNALTGDHMSILSEDATAYDYHNRLQSHRKDAEKALAENRFMLFSHETKRFGELYLQSIIEMEDSFAAVVQNEAAEYQQKLAADPILAYIEDNNDELHKVVHNNGGKGFNLKDIVDWLDVDMNQPVTIDEARTDLYSSLDLFLEKELTDQPFTFQQLQSALSIVNLEPSFEVLNDYIFNRLEDKAGRLQQAYFDEQMQKINADAYQYLLNTMDFQLMGNNTFTPPRRLFLVYHSPKTTMTHAT